MAGNIRPVKSKYVLLMGLFSLIVLAAFSCRHTLEQEKPLEVKVDVNVRIDIYQHASDVLDYIEGESEQLPEPELESEPAEETTGFIGEVIDLAFGIGPAYAAETADEVRYRELAKSMRDRAPKIQQLKTDRSIGENRKGLLTVRKNEKMKNDAEYAAEVKKIVKAENRDRTEFYKVDAKRLNKSYDEIAAAFANARRNKAKSGELVEVKQDGKWIWVRKK